MASCLIVILSGLLLCLINIELVAASAFSIALLGHDDFEGPGASYELVITNLEDGEAKIIIDDFNHNTVLLRAPANGVIEHTLGHEFIMNGSEINNKTIHVTSETTFQLQVFSIHDNYVEGFLGISKENLKGPLAISGYFEYVTTTFCSLGGFCQIGLSVFEDDTGIHMDFPFNTEDIAICSGNGYFRSKRDHVLKLNKFQSAQFESASDLSGVHIYSNKPISVFVGTRNLTQGSSITHMIEQLNPTSNWGTEYVVGTLGQTGYGDILKISTQWVNTMVDIKGYPVFVVANRSHNVWRRLDMDERTYIKASRPIQVVQITGVAYASAEDIMAASMSVVPAIENGEHKLTSSCGKSQAAKFYAVIGAINGSDTMIEGATDKETYYIPYTVYMFWDITASARDIHPLWNYATSINVIVKCRSTAIMPLGLVNHISKPNTTEEKRHMCQELIQGSTTFDTSEEKPQRYQVELGPYNVLQLRVRTCGTFSLQFLEDFDIIGNYTVLTLAKGNIILRECYPKCSQKVSRFGSNHYFNCTTDMKFYWFSISKLADDYHFSYGIGPFASRVAGNSLPSDGYFTFIPKPFVRVLMTATPGSAVFNYDLETEEECDFHTPGWRCEDTTSRCAAYGSDMCKNYQEFAARKCAKYCQLCVPDSYGRKFIFAPNMYQYRPPTAVTNKLVINIQSSTQANIAVGSGEGEGETLSYEYSNDSHGMNYNLLQTNDKIIVIVADEDVTVTLSSFIYLSGVYQSQKYTVYPVDNFGKEIFHFENASDQRICKTVSEYPTTDIKVVQEHFETADNTVNNSKTQHGMARVYTSDKPFAMFCSGLGSLLPSEKWGKMYVVPALGANSSVLPSQMSLLLKSNRDNTVVTIDGDFNALHILHARGSETEQEITGLSKYTVIAYHEIEVILLIKEYNSDYIIDYHVIPPYNGLFGVDVDGVEEKSNHLSDNIEVYFVDRYSLKMRNMTSKEEFDFQRLQKYPDRKQSDYCHTSVSTPGDKIDNDCDGLVDEDICFSGYGVYGEDYDIDGGFGEDCDFVIDEFPLVNKPTDPTCIEIMKPVNQCWLICQCNCDWLNSLETYNEMTELEKEVLHDTVDEKQRKELKVDQETLSKTTSQKISAVDQRRSATNIGYVGVAVFTVVFGTVLVMDIKSLVRDVKITFTNLKDGAELFWNFIKTFKDKAKNLWLNLQKIKPWIQRAWQLIKSKFTTNEEN